MTFESHATTVAQSCNQLKLVINIIVAELEVVVIIMATNDRLLTVYQTLLSALYILFTLLLIIANTLGSFYIRANAKCQ